MPEQEQKPGVRELRFGQHFNPFGEISANQLFREDTLETDPWALENYGKVTVRLSKSKRGLLKDKTFCPRVLTVEFNVSRNIPSRETRSLQEKLGLIAIINDETILLGLPTITQTKGIPRKYLFERWGRLIKKKEGFFGPPTEKPKRLIVAGGEAVKNLRLKFDLSDRIWAFI